MLEKIDVNFKKNNQIIEQSNITKQLIIGLRRYTNKSVIGVAEEGQKLEFKKSKQLHFKCR